MDLKRGFFTGQGNMLITQKALYVVTPTGQLIRGGVFIVMTQLYSDTMVQVL